MSISKGSAEVEMAVREAFFHAAGAMHGSVYFKVLDDAAFFACNSLIKDFFVLTVQFNIYFTRPISSGSVKGIGRVVSRARHLLTAEATLYNGDGKEIARGNGSFTKSRIRLTPQVGYQ
jgi:uncharacterized protein (TIGR00369 family)